MSFVLLQNEPKIEELAELQHIQDENKLLKERLTQLGYSFDQTALSDSEKEMLLKQNKMPRSVQSLPDVIDSSPDYQVG